MANESDRAQGAAPARLSAWGRLNALSRRGASAPSFDAHDSPDDSPDQQRRDRAQADELVRGVLRHLTLIDYWLDRAAALDPRKTPPANLWVLRIAAYEKLFRSSVPDYAIGQQAVSLARRVAGAPASRFINATVRRMLPNLPTDIDSFGRDPGGDELPESIRCSVPQPIINVLLAGYGPDIGTPVLAALASREAATGLRVNTLRAEPAQLAEALRAEGTETALVPGLNEALLWTDGRLPWRTDAWKRGELTVQDPGAMLAGRLLNPRPGGSLLDLCAAPGGKAGHAWELMAGRGRLVAVEIDSVRRATLRETLRRLYGEDHGIEVPDVSDSLEVISASPPFDAVLIDAPCLALGLIGRHPEIRWDGRLARLPAFQERQRRLLETGSRAVRPGGRLLWVTCSPTRAENEEILLPWLAARSGWEIERSFPDGPDILATSQEGVHRTRPDLAPCDGFALAMLRRPESS